MSDSRSPAPATAPLNQSNFVRAARGERPDRRPVWFMRQAGRSLPEYRPVRGEGTILDAIADADRAAEITLQPVRRYGVDAAILFSDIVTPVWAAGFGITITPGIGPTCEQPFAGPADLDRLSPLEADGLDFQTATVRQLVTELSPRGVPVIGFAGGPFTLASYLIEGKPSRDYAKVKALMMADPATWHRLCDRLADLAIMTLSAQVAAGASAIQLFDSWAGALRPEHYRRFVKPHSTRILQAMGDCGVPRVHFGINTGELLADIADAGAEMVGVDWRTPLADARQRTDGRVALQGNLDPALVLGPWESLETEVLRVLVDNGDALDHVFNLGHGVLPETDPDQLARVVDLVHSIPPGTVPVDELAARDPEWATIRTRGDQ